MSLLFKQFSPKSFQNVQRYYPLSASAPSLGSPFSLGLLVGLIVPLLVVPRLCLEVELSRVAEQELGQDRGIFLPYSLSARRAVSLLSLCRWMYL